MAVIKIDISEINSTLQDMKSEHSKFNTTKSDFQSTCNNINYNIKQKRAANGATIGHSISIINSKLNNIDNKLKSIERTIEFATVKYAETESKVMRNLKLSGISDIKDNEININKPKVEKESFKEKISSIFNGIDEFFGGFDEYLIGLAIGGIEGLKEFVDEVRDNNDFFERLKSNGFDIDDNLFVDKNLVDGVSGTLSGILDFAEKIGWVGLAVDYISTISETIFSKGEGMGFIDKLSGVVVDSIEFVIDFAVGAFVGIVAGSAIAAAIAAAPAIGATIGTVGVGVLVAAGTGIVGVGVSKLISGAFNYDFKDQRPSLSDYLKEDLKETITGTVNIVSNGWNSLFDKDENLVIGNAVPAA